MKLSPWLNTDKTFPVVGKECFNTFLKICSEFSEWALDDIGLANRANVYKIWICKIKSQDIQKVRDILKRYSSMKLLLHYFNVNIVEEKSVGLYIKLDWNDNKWMISYGITDNRKLYKIGEFEYKFTLKLPEHRILKYIIRELDDFNPREHLLLYRIKKDTFTFNPGYCQITDAKIINQEILVSAFNLGIWNGDNLEYGEAEKYLSIFKEWVKTHKWCNNVKIIVRPRKNNWIDFILKIK